MKSNILDSTANLRNEVNVLEPEPDSLIPRGYSRVSPDVNFSVMAQRTIKEDRDYYEDIIEDVRLGGMFIKTDHPFPKGSVVAIKFRPRIKEDRRSVRARGLISWTQKWKRPHGMGIDFIEFDGLRDTPFEEWFKKNFQQE